MFSNEEYWNWEFVASAARESLQEFIVIDIEHLNQKGSKKTQLAEITIAKASDIGRNDVRYQTLSYLGAFLNCGDSVAGYDLNTINFSESNVKFLKEQRFRSDIVLVKKMFPNRRRQTARRHWKLAKLDIVEIEEKKANAFNFKEQQREEFMRELEEDPEMRSQIHLYKVAGVEPKKNDEEMDDVESDFPEVSVNELIEAVQDLSIKDSF
jgi:nonsense-mediated mRNA decay protein 3